jgi:hypothetical protein
MSQIKLQVPMDKEVRDKLELRAKDFGFDSAQAFVRFWAKAQADGRRFDLGEPEQMTPQMTKIAHDALQEISNGELSPIFNNAKDAIKYLKTAK